MPAKRHFQLGTGISKGLYNTPSFPLHTMKRCHQSINHNDAEDVINTKRSKHTPFETSPIKVLFHAGMGGYLAGEPPNGYKEGSSTGQRKHLISPRLNFEAVLNVIPGAHFIGPVTKSNGGRLTLSDATRCSPNGVLASLTFLRANVEANDQVIICTSGPGCENALESFRGHRQDFKTRESFPLDVPSPSAEAYLNATKGGCIGAIKGYIFLTPITVTKKAPDEIPNEKRIAPLLELPEGTNVLVVTGDKDAKNLQGIRLVIDRMQCKATTRLHICLGSRHNPFDSIPVKKIEEKNVETQQVVDNFIRDCCGVV